MADDRPWSGKSTLVEAIAMAFGLSPEGGSTGARHSTRQSESPLHSALSVVRGAGGARWGYFLRAETMHGLFTYLEDNPGLAAEGSPMLVATHSPIVASLPGAQILELDEHGLHTAKWEDLDVVDHYRRSLAGPARYLRHLVE